MRQITQEAEYIHIFELREMREKSPANPTARQTNMTWLSEQSKEDGDSESTNTVEHDTRLQKNPPVTSMTFT